MDILKKLKDLGITIPEDKEADLTNALKDLKDQDTVNKLVGDAKGKGKNKILKELGFEDIESAKNALAKLKGKGDGEQKKDINNDEKYAELQKQLQEIKTAQKQEKENAEKEKISSDQINTLIKKGFSESAAKRLRNTIAAEMQEDDKFEDKVKEFSQDEFYKTQFDKASENLKKGTIQVGSNENLDVTDEEVKMLESIFGVEKEK